MDESKSSDDVMPKLSLLRQRTIEARIAGPLINAFRDRFGDVETLATVDEVVANLARASGEKLAEQAGDGKLATFAENLARWKEGNALEIEIVESDDEHLDFNVKRCRYAEMYREEGLADLGFHLSCVRDFALIEGFNPAIKLERTQTLMEGAAFCDFRFHAKKVDPESP